jgi:Flp pilus assembly protein TadB
MAEKSKKGLVIGIVVVVALAVIIGAAIMWHKNKKKKEAEEQKSVATRDESRGTAVKLGAKPTSTDPDHADSAPDSRQAKVVYLRRWRGGRKGRKHMFGGYGSKRGKMVAMQPAAQAA